MSCVARSRSTCVLDASVAMRSKMSFTKEFKMAMALFEIPVSGWTCLRTGHRHKQTQHPTDEKRTLVDIRRVCLLAQLSPFLLLLASGLWSGGLCSLLCGLGALYGFGGLLGRGSRRGCFSAGSGGGFGGHDDDGALDEVGVGWVSMLTRAAPNIPVT